MIKLQINECWMMVDKKQMENHSYNDFIHDIVKMFFKNKSLILSILLLANIIGIIFGNLDEICPSYEILYPCFCNFMPKYNDGSVKNIECNDPNLITRKCHSTVITCIGNRMTQLRQIFQQIYPKNNNRKFEWFYMIDQELESLENYLFANIYFENIYLQNCPKLLYLDEYTFGNQSEQLYSVQNIYLNTTNLSDQIRLKRKTFKALSLLKNLNVLEFQSHSIRTLPFKAFNKFTNVRIIRFYNPEKRGQLRRINSKVFYRATNLQEIDLKNNQINHISSYAFQFQRQSRHELRIYLSGNELHSNSFEPNAFDGGNGRKIILYLGDYGYCNLMLQTLKQNVFETFLQENNENIIDMYGCPLICDQQMNWFLTGNGLIRYRNQIRNFICYNKTDLIDTDRYEYYHVHQ
ncbi:uncharacterized protein LOC113788993 [Dermatophagoides pteronyssinus]|uniref:uncharacterized protein LOC113788993 n=1 Tax=Dermatophagoides pteronyssinus TaxID=6956 RepID=UPI003F67F939